MIVLQEKNYFINFESEIPNSNFLRRILFCNVEGVLTMNQRNRKNQLPESLVSV